jgi:hypothetical protein
MTIPTAGPLQVHPANPRYFADCRGRAVYLTGSHTWDSLQDLGQSDPPPAITALQEACMRRVVEAVNDLGNALYLRNRERK